MQPLDNLPSKTLLVAYARYTGSHHLQHLTRFVSSLGYRATSSIFPAGREITSHDIRRRLQPLLKAFPAYPTTRAPRQADFDRIKEQILAEYEEGEMV